MIAENGLTRGFSRDAVSTFESCPLCGAKVFGRMFSTSKVAVARCAGCRMMFQNPYLKASAMERIFSSRDELLKVSPFFGRYMDEEAWNTAKTLGIYRRCLKELASLCPSKGNVLDVGCGRGAFLKLAHGEGWRAEGLETSTEHLKSFEGDSDIVVSQKDFLSMDGNDGTWDVIALWDLIEHVNDPVRWVRQCFARLKPRGFLVIATPNHFSLLDFLSYCSYRLSFGLIKGGLEKLYTIDHTLYFTHRTLGKLLEDAGFRLMRTIRVNTDLGRYTMSPAFRFFSELLLAASSLAGLENRVILIAGKDS